MAFGALLFPVGHDAAPAASRSVGLLGEDGVHERFIECGGVVADQQ
jgi:hypothetical protein